MHRTCGSAVMGFLIRSSARESFYVARGMFLARNRRYTDEEMLGQLRALLAKHDMLSSFLIDSADDMPASSAYRTRFGSLLRAYQLAGYRPDRDYRYLEINRALGQLHPQLIDNMLRELNAAVHTSLGTCQRTCC